MVKVIKEVKKQDKPSIEKNSISNLENTIAFNKSIIESTADGILVIDLYGKVVTYNKKFQELWRIPDSLVSTRDDKKLIDFVLDQLEDPKAFTEKVNELYDHTEITSFDTLKFKDGRVFNRYSQPQMIGKEIVGRVWSFRDVSKQKELEESLRKSKERFYSHIENMSLIAVGLDNKGTIQYVNAALCKLFGLDKKEILGRNWFEEFIPERYRQEIIKVSEKEFESELHPNYENPILLPNGKERLIRWNNTVNPVVDGKPYEAMSVGEDVTEIRATEEALRKSEERFELALEAVEEGVWDWNLVTNEIYFSPRWEKLYGYSPGEVEPHSQSLEKLVYPADKEPVMQAFKDHAEGRTDSYHVEHRVKTKSGGWVWTLGRGKIIERDEAGKPLRMVGTAKDITKRKQAEELLKRSKDYLEKLNNSLGDVIVNVKVPERRIEYVNHAIEKVFGYTPDECIGKQTSLLYPSEEEYLDFGRLLKSALKEGKDEFRTEKNFKRKNGKTIICEVTTTFLKDNGKVTNCISIIHDITDRKQVEQKLLKNETLFRNYFELGQVGMAIISPDQKWLKINDRLSEILGYSEQELKKITWTELTHPDDLEPDQIQFGKVLSREIGRYEIDKRFIHKCGKIVSVHLTIACQRNLDGTVDYIIASLQDITERNEMEKMLVESEKKISLLLNSTGEAIYGLDLSGKCTFVNPSCIKMLGYKGKNQLTNKNMHELIHHTRKDGTPYPEQECKIYMAFRKGICARVCDEVFWRSDGTSFPVEYQSFPIFDGEKVIGSVVTFVDISDRLKAQEATKSSLQEKELLLREIHHRVKNNMQVISSLLQLQSGYIKDEKVLAMFQESQSRIKSMSMIHEKLYQSKNLANINLMDYIKDLANDMFRLYSINTNNIALRLSDEAVYFGIDNAVPFGLIVNELLSNCLKYAFPEGRKGEIRITLRYISDSRFQISELKPQSTTCDQNSEIELIFNDNGVGLPDNIDYRKTKSLGMQLIKGLAEDQLGGKIELNRDKGTEFKIIFKDLKDKEKI